MFAKSFSARGLAIGDFDNDGAVDVLISNNDGAPVLLRNNAGRQGHWLGVRLIGSKSNRDAVSARVTYRAGDLKRSRTKVGGGSLLSSHGPRLVLGIGARKKIDWIDVKWPLPSGAVQRISNLPLNRYITIEEGRAGVSSDLPVTSSFKTRLAGNRHGVAFTATAGQVVHGNVQIDVPAGGFDCQDHSFRIARPRESLIVHVNLWRKNFEAVALIVQQRHGISDDHIRELTDRLANDLLAIRYLCTGKNCSNLQRDFRSEIENDATLDIPLDDDQRGNTLPVIGSLFHQEVANHRWTLQ